MDCIPYPSPRGKGGKGWERGRRKKLTYPAHMTQSSRPKLCVLRRIKILMAMTIVVKPAKQLVVHTNAKAKPWGSTGLQTSWSIVLLSVISCRRKTKTDNISRPLFFWTRVETILNRPSPREWFVSYGMEKLC